MFALHNREGGDNEGGSRRLLSWHERS